MAESILMKPGMYIVASELIPTAILHKFLSSVCVSLCVSVLVARQHLGKNYLIVARQRLGKQVTAAMNTQ
jgi:hypothetical protein